MGGETERQVKEIHRAIFNPDTGIQQALMDPDEGLYARVRLNTQFRLTTTKFLWVLLISILGTWGTLIAGIFVF